MQGRDVLSSVYLFKTLSAYKRHVLYLCFIFSPLTFSCFPLVQGHATEKYDTEVVTKVIVWSTSIQNIEIGTHVKLVTWSRHLSFPENQDQTKHRLFLFLRVQIQTA